MPAPYPTLTISQFISPAESRGLWLSLYAAAFARGLPILESLDVATRGVIALSASVLANDPALPPWLKTYDDEAEEVPDAVAPESASARAEGSGGATPRERAVQAVLDVRDAAGMLEPSSREVIAAIEAAGLRIVDAAEHERDQQLLRESIDALAAGPTIRVLGGNQDYPAAPGSRSTDRCPECRATSAHKMDCGRGPRRYTGPAKGL